MNAYLRRVFEVPPWTVPYRAARFAGRAAARRLQRLRDIRSVTFCSEGPTKLVRRVALTPEMVPPSLATILPDLTQRYLDHRFDLLGSGWAKVHYGLSAPGLNGHRFPAAPAVVADREGRWLAGHVTAANLAKAQSLWRLIEGDYAPIDWQIDFKSGFRWNSARHFTDLSFGDVEGADVKVPWELARLQHLPQLATAHLLAKAGMPGFLPPEKYSGEVRNLILDFIAANPPRFGVNWVCPMDVGIRAANMLLAVDLLRAGGFLLDAAFEEAVARAALEHGRHITRHLEWSPTPRSNHYLADIAGVLFCALYLPSSDETDAWLDFAAHQLDAEIIAQFLPDGGNFEGSTNYHRLSAELALFSAAGLMGAAPDTTAFDRGARHGLTVRPSLGQGAARSCVLADSTRLPLSAEAVERLARALACVRFWSKPDGRPPQIGDTDSGRLFKLHPPLVPGAPDLQEDMLDHRALSSLDEALFGGPATHERWFDGAVASALAGTRKLPAQPPTVPLASVGTHSALTAMVSTIKALQPASRRDWLLDLPGLEPQSLERFVLSDFGLYVWRNADTFISLRCLSDVAQSHTMGHFHDDNLALEVYHRGENFLVDPGSYLYTPSRADRARYRSAAAHGVPRVEGCAAAHFLDAFTMRIKALARCVYFGPHGVAAVLDGDGWCAFRVVTFEEGRLVVRDGCEGGSLGRCLSLPVSEGYGRIGKVSSNRCVLT